MSGRPFELRAGEELAIQGPHGGAFTVLAPLAAGASSQAWRARRADGVFAVLKTQRWESQAGHELVIEEEILRQLRSRNLIQFFGRGERQGRPVLAYERVFMNPLLVLSDPAIRTKLPRDPKSRYYPLPPRMALSLGVDLLRGLEHMHALGFVHHDVKPANLMMRLPELERTEAVPMGKLAALASQSTPVGVLIDIGATRSQVFLDDFNRGEIDPSIVPPQLTPSHAPPESLLKSPGPHGERPFLHASLDVYAAALVIYAAISGHGPFDHEPGGTAGGLERILALKTREREGKAQPIQPQALAAAPGVDPRLAQELFALLRKCVSPRLETRPAAKQAREGLERICAAHGVSTARSGRLSAAAEPPPPPSQPKTKLPQSSSFYAELERIEQRNKAPTRRPRPS